MCENDNCGRVNTLDSLLCAICAGRRGDNGGAVRVCPLPFKPLIHKRSERPRGDGYFSRNDIFVTSLVVAKHTIEKSEMRSCGEGNWSPGKLYTVSGDFGAEVGRRRQGW